MTKKFLFALVPVAFLFLPALADAKLVRSGGAPSVQFKGAGSIGTMQGTTSELSVADDGTTVTVTVALANLATGISLRDRHMRDKYLEVGKFPNAVLTVPRASLAIKPEGDLSGDTAGTFTVHGVTKPVKFNYVAKRAGKNSFDVTGKLRINVLEFGMEKPSYAGVGIKPDIDIEAHFTATDQ